MSVFRLDSTSSVDFLPNDNFNYSSFILNLHIKHLKSLYPFLEIISSGKSVLGKDIPVIKIGNGKKEVFYSGAIHRK